MDDALGWAAIGLSIVNSVVLFLLMREVGLLKTGGARKAGMKFDSQLPDFDAASLGGPRISSAEIRRTLLLFVTPDCTQCQNLLRDLRSAAGQIPPLTVAVSGIEAITGAARDRFVASLDFLGANRVLFDEGRRMFGALNVPVTPFAYAINGSGRIRGSAAPLSAPELNELAKALD